MSNPRAVASPPQLFVVRPPSGMVRDLMFVEEWCEECAAFIPATGTHIHHAPRSTKGMAR